VFHGENRDVRAADASSGSAGVLAGEFRWRFFLGVSNMGSTNSRTAGETPALQATAANGRISCRRHGRHDAGVFLRGEGKAGVSEGR